MLIGVPQETAAGEARVAATPETVKKLVAQGHTLRVQQSAGLNASVTDEAYAAAGAEIDFGTHLLDVGRAPVRGQPLRAQAHQPQRQGKNRQPGGSHRHQHAQA